MPKLLFLTVHRPDRSPSQRFRFEQYIPFLKQNGFECTHFFLLDEKDDKIFYSKGKIFAKLVLVIKSLFSLNSMVRKANDYDVIFIQRESFMLGTSYFEKKLSRSRAKLVYDFDDSLWLLDISNANKAFSFLKNPDKTSKLIAYSSAVIAGNKYLAEYAKQYNKNVHIIPTTINTSVYNKKAGHTNDEICIGWSGSMTTIKHFESAVPVLVRLKEKYGKALKFKVVGDPTYVNAKLGIKGTLWKSETEVDDLLDLDIGIMPLPDDKWTQGKCGLKGLQYMALGIPTIMSPVGVNTEIINDGVNGFLASTDEEWMEKLSRLIESKALRERIGSEGQKTVKERFSVESQKENYLKVLKDL